MMTSTIQLGRSTEKSALIIDNCIICQKQGKKNLTSTQNGRRNIIDAANIRQDEVCERLQSGSIEKHFNYHLTNKCYKIYTLKKTLDNIKVSENKILFPLLFVSG